MRLLLIIIFILLSLLPTVIMIGSYLWLKYSTYTIDFHLKGLTIYVNAVPVNKETEWTHIAIVREQL